MPNSSKDIAMKTFDMSDPNQVERSRASYYMSMYANKTEIELNPEDVRFTFVQIQGMTGERLRVEDQASIIMTHRQALGLLAALKRLLEQEPKQSE
jgi:hypothetical protein